MNKPINMLTQSDDTHDADLLTIMKEYIRDTYNKPGNVYLGMVHRLDRVTGGIVVFAKTSKAASRLSNQIRLNEWKKQYLVITDGKVKQEKAKLVDYLHKDRKTNTSSVVSEKHKEGKKSILYYRHKKSIRNNSLLKVDLVTGRSHQIRVQLANHGFPLYGDHRYNKQVVKKSQIKLYAHYLEIIHPTTKERLNFTVYPPQFGLWEEFYK